MKQHHISTKAKSHPANPQTKAVLINFIYKKTGYKHQKTKNLRFHI